MNKTMRTCCVCAIFLGVFSFREWEKLEIFTLLELNQPVVVVAGVDFIDG